MPEFLTPFGGVLSETGSFQALVPFGAFAHENQTNASDLTGAAIAAATGQSTLSVEALLATNAVGAAIAAGTLDANVPLTASAIASAVGSAALEAYTRVWRLPVDAPNGTSVYLKLTAGSAPSFSILEQGLVTVAGGFADLPTVGVHAVGSKRFTLYHNWDSDVETTSIYGGAGIATKVEL